MFWRELKKFASLLSITLVISTPQLALAKRYYKPTYAALVVDAKTHKVLYHRNANTRINPASLTKMMTIYLAFEAIKNKKLSMSSRLNISKKAASMPKSNIDLIRGQRITLREAILSLIVKSANDSAVAIAENISGSEYKFALLMNKRAKQLGMRSSNFVNASGWHHRKQKTTALDMAKLAIALKRDYPEYYHLFSRTSFYYKNKLYKSHNHVLTNLKGAEGMKTGYTSKAGWNLVTTASRNNSRLVGVIIGGRSSASRDKKMVSLLNTHFYKIKGSNKNKTMYAKSVSYTQLTLPTNREV